MSQDKVPLTRLLLFSLPNLAVGVAITAMSVVLPGFYAKHTMAGLAGVAAGMLTARVLEVVTDPLIGHLTDLTRGRLGARKPWLILGAVLTPVCMLFLFNPPASSGALYFIVWSALAYLSWTLINIPYRGWAVELSRDYDERSKIFVALGIAQGVGAIVFSAAPFLPMFKTTEMGPEALRAVGVGLAIGFPATIALAVAFVPTGEQIRSERPSLLGLWRSVTGNRPLWWYLAACFFGGVAQSIVLACFFFFADSYLGLGDQLPLALVLVYAGGFLGMPLWLWVMLRLGKPKTWAIGYGLTGLVGAGLGLLPPGPGSTVPFLALCAIFGMMSAVDAFAPYAVLGDVIDYDHWKTGTNRAGNYNALSALMQKANYAIGGSLAFMLLGLVHFDVTGKANTAQSRWGFLAVFCVLPVVFYLASSVVIWLFPIDRHRHTIIRRRLEQRAVRQDGAAA